MYILKKKNCICNNIFTIANYSLIKIIYIKKKYIWCQKSNQKWHFCLFAQGLQLATFGMDGLVLVAMVKNTWKQYGKLITCDNTNLFLTCIVKNSINFKRPVQHLVVHNLTSFIFFGMNVDCLHWSKIWLTIKRKYMSELPNLRVIQKLNWLMWKGCGWTKPYENFHSVLRGRPTHFLNNKIYCEVITLI